MTSCVKCSTRKEKDTQSATTSFGKEEVLKIRQGIQVFARNTRSSYIVVFPLGQGRGSQELNQNRKCHIYIYIRECIYIYTHMCIYIQQCPVYKYYIHIYI